MEDLKQTSQDGQLLLRAFHRLNLYLLNHLLVFFGPVRWFDTSGGVSPLSNSAILEPFEGESMQLIMKSLVQSSYIQIPLEKGPAHTSVCPVCPE